MVETCRSVDEQTLSPFEHLIIDGSTNDEILTWLQKNVQPSYRRWIHERDKGISDAFNKGIKNANGDIIHLLNSGDRYADKKALETVSPYFENDPQLMWTNANYVQHRGDIDVISGLPFDKNKLWKGMRTVAHPSMFIRKQVYARAGGYDEDYKIAMDFDMLVRIRNEKNAFIPKPVAYFAPGGVSNEHFEKGLIEVKRSYQHHIGNDPRLAWWQRRQRLLKLFMQTSIGRLWFRLKNKKA